MGNKEPEILYLSHGKPNTGGHNHEQFLAEKIAASFGYTLRSNRFETYFEGIGAHLKLVKKGFRHANSEIVLSVARLSLPVLLRNLINQTKIVLVWHFYDEQGIPSVLLRTWYRLSLLVMKQIPSHKLCVVVVAPYWKTYFSEILGESKVIYFPNFFDGTYYQKFKTTTKKKQVHLGQVSFKNSGDLHWIASQLKGLGYDYYMSTGDVDMLRDDTFPDIPIRYFDTHEAYLKEMACSAYTLALPSFNEGWNRVAHESLLVGTSVIGYAKGGLADLLQLSGAGIAKNKEEVLAMIVSEKEYGDLSSLREFEHTNFSFYLEEIEKWKNKTKK